MRSFFLPNWSPPDDPARPLPAEGRPWPSDDDDDDDDDDDGSSFDAFSHRSTGHWNQTGTRNIQHNV